MNEPVLGHLSALRGPPEASALHNGGGGALCSRLVPGQH